MQEGTEATKRMLLELRARRRNTGLAVLAGVVEASIPADQPARTEFFIALTDYLVTALDGASLDPDYL